MKRKKKIAVALSGGKDSTTAVLLMKEKNYDVVALTMKLGIDGEDQRLEKIEHLTNVMQVPWEVVDVTAAFREKVISYFIDAYANSLTPNPCAVCNKEVKFNLLFREALQKHEADLYATGHYAQITHIAGDCYLSEPKEREKSQIYFLAMIGRDALRHVIFPLADRSINEVRENVKDLPLPERKESQDVCFISNKILEDFLRNQLPYRYFKPGDFLDMDGHPIGRHNGAVYFTIGQRRGIRFSSDRRLYVVKKDVPNNTITLGEEKYLYTRMVKVKNPVFWRELKVGDIYTAKFRYKSPFYKAIIHEACQDHIIALFPEPAKAITPGQIAVFYQDDIIVAAGFIS